jgi:hypothetical protein
VRDCERRPSYYIQRKAYGREIKMSGGFERFIILLLGAFIVMLVITLASEPWKYPERTPILALFVAVAALLLSGANTFFTLFYHPEDLRVYRRAPARPSYFNAFGRNVA